MLLGSRIAVAVALSGGCSCDWALAWEPPCAASVALKDKKTKKKKKKKAEATQGKRNCADGKPGFLAHISGAQRRREQGGKPSEKGGG